MKNILVTVNKINLILNSFFIINPVKTLYKSVNYYMELVTYLSTKYITIYFN